VFGSEVLKDAERQVQMIRENLRIAQSHQKSYTNSEEEMYPSKLVTSYI
jgi:hypothetical protein